MTADEIWKMPPGYLRDTFLGDLSRRWRCVGCDEVVMLRVPAVIGNYCCPGCGYTLLRPWYLELPPMLTCMWCDEPVSGGVEIPHMAQTITLRPWHRDCLARSIIGGLNHLRGTCQCCGGTDDPDPPEMSKREAAIAAMNYWKLTNI